MTFTLRMFLFISLLSAPLAARAETLVVCWVGGPGNTAQAKEGLDKFLKHLEKSGGLKKGSISGEYHTTARGCLDFIQQKKPALGVFDLVTYLQLSKSHKLKPLAHMGDAKSNRYHVVIRKDQFKDLKALKGQSIISTVEDLRFLSRIILGNKLDATKDLKVKITGYPAKAFTKVARAKYAAAVVDKASFDLIKTLELKADMASLHASPDLPGLTMTLLGKGDKDLPAAVLKAMPKLCSGAGKELCDLFNIKNFIKAKAKTYKKLQKQYWKK